MKGHCDVILLLLRNCPPKKSLITLNFPLFAAFAPSGVPLFSAIFVGLFYIFSAILNFALLLLVLLLLSSSCGVIGFCVITLKQVCLCPYISFSIFPAVLPDLIKFLTILSSRE